MKYYYVSGEFIFDDVFKESFEKTLRVQDEDDLWKELNTLKEQERARTFLVNEYYETDSMARI